MRSDNCIEAVMPVGTNMNIYNPVLIRYKMHYGFRFE